eukprot:scaffold64815_cov34-Tisochrysis_lutea.AAC.7
MRRWVPCASSTWIRCSHSCSLLAPRTESGGDERAVERRSLLSHSEHVRRRGIEQCLGEVGDSGVSSDGRAVQ